MTPDYQDLGDMLDIWSPENDVIPWDVVMVKLTEYLAWDTSLILDLHDIWNELFLCLNAPDEGTAKQHFVQAQKLNRA